MRFALVADVHMRDEDADAVTRELERAVDRIGPFDPDRTIVLGDLIQDESPVADRRNVERVVETLAPLEPRYLAGNHDVETLDTAEFAALVGNEPEGRETISGTDLLYLDTSAPHLPGARSEIPEGQLRDLRAVLTGSDEALLFAHHPVHRHDLSNNPWFADRPELAFPANAARVQRILSERGDGVLATFNGHLHELYHAHRRGVDHFTINAVNKELPDSDAPTGTHALVTLEDRLRLEVYDRTGFVLEWSVPRPGSGDDRREP